MTSHSGENEVTPARAFAATLKTRGQGDDLEALHAEEGECAVVEEDRRIAASVQLRSRRSLARQKRVALFRQTRVALSRQTRKKILSRLSRP